MVELDFVDIVGDGEVLDALLELCDLFLGGRDDVIDGVDVRGLRLAPDEVDVDVLGDVDVAVGERLEECRLGDVSKFARTSRRWGTHLS